MLTQKGALKYGVEVDGARQTAFEMRVATLEDMEAAIEEAGEGACGARLSRYLWAHTLVRLGTLAAKDITPDLLGALEASEFGVLAAAEQSLRDSLAAASADSATSAA